MKRSTSLILILIGTALVVSGASSGVALLCFAGAVVAAIGAARFWPDVLDVGDTRWRNSAARAVWLAASSYPPVHVART